MYSFDLTFIAAANPVVPANFSPQPCSKLGVTISGPLMGAASWAITAQLRALNVDADIATVYADLREEIATTTAMASRRPASSSATRLGRLMKGLQINPGDNVMDEPSIIGLVLPPGSGGMDLLPSAMSRVSVAWKAISLRHPTSVTSWRRAGFNNQAIPWLVMDSADTADFWPIAAAMGTYGTPGVQQLVPQGTETIPDACAVASLTLHMESSLPCFKAPPDVLNWLKSQATDTPIVVQAGPGQSLKVRAKTLDRALAFGSRLMPPACIDPHWLASRNDGNSIIDP